MSDSSANNKDNVGTTGTESQTHTSFSDVVKAHRWDDMKNVAQNEPCAREGFLYGIGAGIGVGILRFFKCGRGLSAGNWAVLTFAGVAVAAKQLCHFQQAHQRAKIRTLLEMQSDLGKRKVEGFEHDPESDNTSN